MTIPGRKGIIDTTRKTSDAKQHCSDLDDACTSHDRPRSERMASIRTMKHHHIRRLPVVEGEKLVGVITITDVRSLAPLGALPLLEQNALLAHTKIAGVMTSNPFTIAPDENVGEAARLMMRLTQYAQAHDIQTFLGFAHGENYRLLRFVQRIGLPVESKLQGGLWEMRIGLERTAFSEAEKIALHHMEKHNEHQHS